MELLHASAQNIKITFLPSLGNYHHAAFPQYNRMHRHCNFSVCNSIKSGSFPLKRSHSVYVLKNFPDLWHKESAKCEIKKEEGKDR